MKLKNLLWYLVGDTLKWVWPFQLLAYFKRGIAVADAEKKLCVEGYPRSGNTFLYALCSQVLSPELIAHHLHNCAQIKFALSNRIPVLFVARPPLEAISSYIIREDIPASRAFTQYYRLYSYVAENCDSIEVVKFEELTNSTDRVVSEILDMMKIEGPVKIDHGKLRQDIAAMDMADQNSSNVDPLKVGLPTEERAQLKKHLSIQLTSEFQEELKRCQDIYETIVR